MASNDVVDNDERNVDLEKKYKPLIIILSVAIPLVVAALFGIKVEGVDLSFLPPIYASINGVVAVLLVLAVIAIKNKNKARHESLIRFAVLGSILFLIGYVAYHITSDATVFGDIDHNGELSVQEREALGKSAFAYYFILFTHIILSIGVIPLVLFTFLKGWAGNYVSHRKWAKYTFPLWLYVAVTGVVVYVMIQPYYA